MAASTEEFSSPAFIVTRAKSAGPHAALCLFPVPMPSSSNNFPMNFAARREICCVSGPFGVAIAEI